MNVYIIVLVLSLINGAGEVEVPLKSQLYTKEQCHLNMMFLNMHNQNTHTKYVCKRLDSVNIKPTMYMKG